MYKVKVFPLNKDGKIEFTLEELQALLDEVAHEAQKPTVEPLTAGPLTAGPYPEDPYITTPYITTPWQVPKAITYTNPGPDCETCPNRPDPNKIVIGDTPCTWCEKNRITCTSSPDTNSKTFSINTVDKTAKI